MSPTASIENILSITKEVRDIPYGIANTSDYHEVLKLNKGTCSGKHFLLQHYYNEMGLKTRNMIAIHNFADLKVDYPETLEYFLEQNPFIDCHNFLEVNIDNKWLSVDITWDSALSGLGFEINNYWTGQENMKLGVVAKDILQVEEPKTFKENLLSKLNEKEQNDRLIFLQSLSDWFMSYRNQLK